jgi:hypothetical protein
VNRTEPPTFRSADALQERFARRVAAHLEELARQPSASVDERLRFARERALARAREVARPAEASRRLGGGVLGIGGGSSWWLRIASVVPLVLLIAGLSLIHERQWNAQIEAAADIDAALLADDLPPAAYSDPGFAMFLKAPTE